MHKNRVKTAFTIVELLVALVVTSVVLSAIAALAFAMGTATRSSEDVAFAQTEVRTATLRLVELIRNCRMICAAPGNDLVVWKSDDNGDERINLNELVYIESGSAHSVLQLGQFSAPSNPQVAFTSLSLAATKSSLAATYGQTDVTLIRSCSNLQFTWDQAPPLTRRLVVSFDLTEDSAVHHYQVDVAVLGSAANLLNATATDLVTDDD
jgi:type II secretory pathway pseudopilin PulG